MRKMCACIAILGFVCVSSALGSVAFTTPVTEISPGQDITIYLHSTETNVIGMQFDVLTNGGGTASNPHINSGWDIGYEGYPYNAGNLLIGWVQTTQTTVPPIKLGGDLFWFTYHVPNVPVSTPITIGAGLYGGTDPIFVATLDSNNQRVDLIPGSLVLHIPEPMTMALLAIGGLVALRRRHA
jgi:hypothetical protein